MTLDQALRKLADLSEALTAATAMKARLEAQEERLGALESQVRALESRTSEEPRPGIATNWARR